MKGSSEPKARNWQEYNESLVKRGEMYLTFSFLDVGKKIWRSSIAASWDEGLRILGPLSSF